MQDIKDYLSYDPLTGLFTRLKNNRKWRVGSTAGCVHSNGRIYIWYKTKTYQAHRLAWYFTYGELPECDIDHINEDPSDNRICNLRLDINKENLHNISKLRRTNTSGYRGVSWHRATNKWSASICIKNKQIHLGVHSTPEEAHAAYVCAKREHHPFWVENK